MSGLIQFARARAAERATIVNQQRDRVLADPAEDPVHDLRVALRRMEQIFELFDAEALGFDVQIAQTQLTTWLKAAGRVRDCDVVMPLLQAPWTNDLLSFREGRAKDLSAVLNTGGPMAAPKARKSVINEEVAQFARITLPREAKKYFHAGARAARKKHSLKRMHEFRLHGKSLRYAVELFEPLYGPHLDGLQKVFKRTQKVLGDMADARAGMKLLKQMNAPDSVFEPLHKLAQEKRDEFAERWFEEIPDDESAAKWVEYLRRYAKAPISQTKVASRR